MRASAASRVRDYFDLTKPRLLPLVLFSGLPVLGMAAAEWPPFSLVCLILVGIALAAASANTLNSYLEYDLDALMVRTRTRPIPAGRIAPRDALVFGLFLAVVSVAFLFWVAGPAAAGYGLAGILFYVFVYTLWLKPRSAWNAVIGGAAGAVAPLIADAALGGSVGAAGWLVFGIVFFWQPPHVWAIALYRKADYQAAGIPMLPNVVGDGPTRWWMLVCTAFLVPVTTAPFFLGLVGTPYLIAALVANAWFLWHAVQLVRLQTHEAARAVFRVSLGYLFLILGSMIVDLAISRF